MQRWIEGGKTGWRNLGNSIQGATFNDWKDDFLTTGFAGSHYPGWPAGDPFNSILYYDETLPGASENGYTSISNITDAITIGEGLFVWCGDNFSTTAAFTIDVTGPVSTGPINIPISYTNTGDPAGDGTNLIANPYPATIDWDSPNLVRVNVDNAVSVWNSQTQQYVTYVGGVSTGLTNEIASSQAFFVKANGAGASISMDENVKTATDGPFIRSLSEVLTMSLENSVTVDVTALRFNSDATHGFDGEYDSYKLYSQSAGVPSLAYSINDSTDLNVSQLPMEEVDIYVKAITKVSEDHILRFDGFTLLDVPCIFLEDLYTGLSYDLQVVDSVKFFLSDTTTVARFVIHVGAPTEKVKSDVTCYDNKDGKAAFVKSSVKPYDISWYTVTGELLQENTGTIGSDTLYGLAPGAYFYDATDFCGNSTGKIVITEPLEVISDFDVSNDTVYISIDPSVSFTNTSTNATSYLWDFGDGTTSINPSDSHTYNAAGTYYVELQSYNDGDCKSISKDTITVMDLSIGMDELADVDIKYWVNSSHELNVEVTDYHTDRLKVYSVSGSILFDENINSENFSRKFDVSRYSNSILLIKLESELGNQWYRIVDVK